MYCAIYLSHDFVSPLLVATRLSLILCRSTKNIISQNSHEVPYHYYIKAHHPLGKDTHTHTHTKNLFFCFGTVTTLDSTAPEIHFVFSKISVELWCLRLVGGYDLNTSVYMGLI